MILGDLGYFKGEGGIFGGICLRRHWDLGCFGLYLRRRLDMQ